MSDVFHMLDLARSQMERVKSLATQIGLGYIDLEPTIFGVGIALYWAEEQFVVLTIMGGGNENQLMFTCGALRDVQQDRLAVLDACNRLTQGNSAYPFYLHDADLGWDILVQQTLPLQVMLDSPAFFKGCCANLPVATINAREKLAEAALGGSPYRWSTEDLTRLLMRSML